MLVNVIHQHWHTPHTPSIHRMRWSLAHWPPVQIIKPAVFTYCRADSLLEACSIAIQLSITGVSHEILNANICSIRKRAWSSQPSRELIWGKNFDPDVIWTRNLLIWSQTRYRCATESSIVFIDCLYFHKHRQVILWFVSEVCTGRILSAWPGPARRPHGPARPAGPNWV